MTILSKLVSSRLQTVKLSGPGTRLFRWDAKPDNIQAHSFPKGLYAPTHWTFKIISVCMIGLFVNWSELRDKYGIRLPNVLFRDTIEYFTSKGRKLRRGEDVPSSLAADVYDKYGEEGVDAMVKAWEQQQDKSMQPELNAIHAVMMAEAAARYQGEVKEEAENMGLSEDEETVKMIAEKTQAMNRGLSVSAEEEGNAEVGEVSESGASKEKIGFRDRKIIEYENRIRQYSAPDKESSQS